MLIKNVAHYLLALPAENLMCVFQGCISVKSYQKSRLNDSRMEHFARKSVKLENGFVLYFENN